MVNNPIVAIFTADYYPFGEKLPTKDTVTGQYRYAYQGQELDLETGMEAFQLRLWDGRIGRWLNPDPYGQYASPYLGMGNNPVSRIDPDGGADGDPQIPPLLSGQQQAVKVYGPQEQGIDMTLMGPEVTFTATVQKGNSMWNSFMSYRFPTINNPLPQYKCDWFEDHLSGYIQFGSDTTDRSAWDYGDHVGSSGEIYGTLDTDEITYIGGGGGTFKFSWLNPLIKIKALKDINEAKSRGDGLRAKLQVLGVIDKDEIMDTSYYVHYRIKHNIRFSEITNGPKQADSLIKVYMKQGKREVYKYR